MAEEYRFEYCAWNRELDYYMAECGDVRMSFENDNQAVLAAETTIEEKLGRGVRKVHCTIRMMKTENAPERWVATLMRPKSEFRSAPTPAPDPNATRVYTGVPDPKKK